MSVNVGSAIAYLDLDASKYYSSLKSAKSALHEFVTSTDSLSTKFNNLGSSISSLGGTMTKSLTVPIVGLGTAATKVAGDFDAAMSKVEAISGSTADEMERLRDKAIEMGAKTKFSAKESADAFTYMAMAGWDAGQMIDGIGGIMSLAAADGLDLATTSDIVTDALTAFGLQASDSAHFADVLAQASSSANTNVSMLGESFKYIGPVAGSLGMSIEDVSIALGLMANSGIKGSQAGTSLRAALTNLVKPTDKMQIAMENLGIEVANSDGTMKSLREIIEILRDRFDGLTESEQASTAATLFGKEAMSGMLAIINASEADYIKLSEAIDNATGRADSMADTMMNNLPGAIEQLMGAVESLMIKVGEALVPLIMEVTEFITKLVEKLNTLSDEEIQQVVKIAGIVAAIGPVLIAIGKVISLIGTVINVGSSIISGIKLLSTFIGTVLIPAISAIGAPVLIVIAVIGALIAAGVALYKNWDEVSAWAKKAWESIKQTVGGAIDAIGEFFSNLGKAISETLTNAKEAVVQWGVNLGRSIAEAAQNMITTFLNFREKMFNAGKNLLTSLWEGIKSVFSSMWNWISNKVSSLIDKISSITNPIKSLVGGAISFISGSHANGLDYVPYDGYVAQLHQGERVLTKEENDDYNNDRSSGGGDTYIFNSPKAIDEYEAARLMKQTKKEIDMDM